MLERAWLQDASHEGARLVELGRLRLVALSRLGLLGRVLDGSGLLRGVLLVGARVLAARLAI
eukprot:2177191-Alexandrium_andersonii.AAC.1